MRFLSILSSRSARRTPVENNGDSVFIRFWFYVERFQNLDVYWLFYSH